MAHLRVLTQAGVAVRTGGYLYAHRDALAVVADRVGAIIATDGAVTLARLRGRARDVDKYAEALLERLDWRATRSACQTTGGASPPAVARALMGGSGSLRSL